MNGGKMRKQARLDLLAEALASNTPLHLKEAASLLNVSEMTIRRDVTTSDGRFDYLGGYIISGNDKRSSLGYFLGREEYTNVEAKKESCRNALTLVENGDVIFLDCGTTLPYLASILPDDMSLTVVCYSVNVAEIVCKKANLKVVLLGGVYHPTSAAFASDEALAMLAKMGINKAFISAGGLHFQNGLSCSNFFEVKIKQAVLNRAMSNILIMDSTKFDKVKAANFAPLSDIQAIATDSGIDAAHKSALTTAGIKLYC